MTFLFVTQIGCYFIFIYQFLIIKCYIKQKSKLRKACFF